MSATSVSRVRTEDAGERSSGMGQAFWLAGKDIRRAWLSYPASGLLLLFFGFIVIEIVNGIFATEGLGASGEAMEDAFNTFFADYMFVIMGCLMVVNAMSLDYVKVWTNDVFSERTAFLRSLPISTGTVVASRAISMLFAALFTVPAFFLPLYFFTGLGDLGFSYVWFCGVWLGWGLLYAGVTLLCELGLSGRVYCWISLFLVAALAAGLLLIENTFGVGLVGSSANLVERFGPLPALAAILVGSLGFWLLARLTVRRVEVREVGS